MLPVVPGLRHLFEPLRAQQRPTCRSSCSTASSHEALAACDVALVASGTATLEAALFKRPMVIAYRMHALSWQMMKRMKYQPWVGLPNILLRDFAVPELLQGEATPERLAHAALAWLDDPQRCAALARALRRPCTYELRRDTAQAATDAIEKILGALSSSALSFDAPGLVAGVDEAGRGPLAGPVVAAAVILDELQPIKGLADSKKLSAAHARAPVRRDPRQGAVLLHRRGHASRRSTRSTSCRPRCWRCAARWRACA